MERLLGLNAQARVTAGGIYQPRSDHVPGILAALSPDPALDGVREVEIVVNCERPRNPGCQAWSFQARLIDEIAGVAEAEGKPTHPQPTLQRNRPRTFRSVSAHASQAVLAGCASACGPVTTQTKRISADESGKAGRAQTQW